MRTGVVTVPPTGLHAQSVRMGIEAATVHGLPGHVGQVVIHGMRGDAVGERGKLRGRPQ